jgi:hypothetical protein
MHARSLGCLRWGFFLVLSAAVLAGCGGNPNLATVTGTITMDGQPLAEAFIKYIPSSGGATSYGKTSSDGTYEMMFNDNEMGAWQGENRVEIRTGDVQGPPERVPSVYNEETTLLVTVQSGTNVFDFELDSSASEIIAAPEE